MGNVFSFGKDEWDPTHRFETSWCIPPYVLSGIRAVISLYCFVTLILIEIYYCVDTADYGCLQAQEEFSYFTVLTYWGMAFYFAVASLHSFTYARTGRPLLDSFPRPLQALHALFYTTIVTYPFIVTAVYWGILYTPPWFSTVFSGWENVSRHMLNSVFGFFELVFTRTQRPLWIHLLWVILIEALYLGVAYITKATRGFYVYSFLDPASHGPGIVAAYVFGIALAVIVVFLLATGIIALRMWITETKLGMNGKMATPKLAAAVDEEKLEKVRPVS